MMLLGCEDCQIAYTDGCKVHKIVMIEDRAILSRAWASLPVNLQIYRLNAEPNENSIGKIFMYECVYIYTLLESN